MSQTALLSITPDIDPASPDSVLRHDEPANGKTCDGYIRGMAGEIRVIPCPVGISSETGRCNAVNRIAFSLRQSGEYRCTIGTVVCRDANTTDRGTVTGGQVSGRNLSMRVVLPGDLSSCLYNGSEYSPREMRGTYRCYQGGGLVEVGIWQVRRGACAPQKRCAQGLNRA